LRIDGSFVSVVKLHKLGNYESGIESLCHIREVIPDPYEIIFSVKRIDERESQVKLSNISKREESGQDLKSHKKYLEAQSAIEEMDLQGKKVFEVELTILMWFSHASYIGQESFNIRDELKVLGDFGVENIGIFPAFRSALPGGRPHVSNIELTDRVPSYFPILIRGRENIGKLSKRSFLFHRSDDTIDGIDIYDMSQQNFSTIVIGESGRGKSVFTNNLLQSLLNDQDLKVILVDVKGSYTNTVNRLQGKVHKISTSQNSSMSPFNYLRLDTSLDVVEILSDFLEKLILEPGETNILNTEQANLEECLVRYTKLRPKNPSIDDFVKKVDEIPRVDSLKRWIRGGVYEKVFSSYDEIPKDQRLNYFDFTNIVTAQKGGVGPAIMSAIMAHFNYTLISKQTHEKLVFIADETPFFVKSCFSSFALLMKNVRKLNGSLILIAQNLSDLIVNSDTSLINQANTRVFFSREKGFSGFLDASGLSERSVSYLDNLGTFNGRYAQFLIKDNRGGERVGKLRLSRQEYFQSTTHSNDREKIEAICKIFGLSNENKAIEILADIGARHEITI
jgi:Cdc6-like AAA superfamily ATPase